MKYEYGEEWWNYADRGKLTNSGKKQSQCHCVHHKSHMDLPGHKHSPCGDRPETNHLSHRSTLLQNVYHHKKLKHVKKFTIKN
jgi:hypothetical protein